MKNEIFILNLVKVSEDLRVLITSNLDRNASFQRDYLLMYLPRIETLHTLAHQLECKESQVFSFLSEDYLQVWEERPLPPFKFEYFRQILRAQIKRGLPRRIGYGVGAGLDDIFDTKAILHTLFAVDPQKGLELLQERANSPILTEIALEKLLVAKEKVEQYFEINLFQWEELIDEQHWLRHDAMIKLLGYAERLDYKLETNSRLLAAAIKDFHKRPPPKRERDSFDALAIISLQQRINWIIKQLRERAEELTSTLVTHDVSPYYKQLEGDIAFYELGAPAVAWRALFPILKEKKKFSVQDRLTNFELKPLPAAGTPQPTVDLQVRSEIVGTQKPFWRFWEKSETTTKVVISCLIKEQMELLDILEVPYVSQEQIDYLTKLFHSIPGQTIATTWQENLGLTLLQTNITDSSSNQQVMLHTYHQMAPDIIRGLILANVPVPSDPNSLWKTRISNIASVTIDNQSQDIIFPKTQKDMLSQIVDQYSHAEITIIR